MSRAGLAAEYAAAMDARISREAFERDRVFGLVADRRVGWSFKVGTAGGFIRRSSSEPFAPGELIALYQLARSGRIEIVGSVVSVTALGRARGAVFTDGDDE